MENQTEQKIVNVEALKRKHGTVYSLTIPRNDESTEFAVGYLRKPDRATLKVVISKIDNDPVSAMEILLNTCWLEGDEDIKTDDELFFGAMGQLQQMVTIRTGELKKI